MNAYSARLGVYLQDLVASLCGSPRFIRLSTRLSGEVQSGVRRGDHVVENVVLVGVNYLNLVERSRDLLTAEVSDPNFCARTAAAMATAGLKCEITGAPITTQDVQDACTGTTRGRKGLLTAYGETLAGSNLDSTCSHVYEPLTVDGDVVPGCKVYNRVPATPGTDPKAPVVGTVYIAGITISSKVVEPSPNGDKVPGRRGPVAMVKDYLEETLGLPSARYRTYRLLPGERYEVSCGSEAFHATLGGNVARGMA